MEKNQYINAFLSIPIQGKRHNEKVYKLIIEIINSNKIEVINSSEISNPPLDDEVAQLSPSQIYYHDIELLKRSQIFITEISSPSLGVGYEIAIAEKLNLPIVYIYNSDQSNKVSLMILGSDYKNRITIEYKNETELSNKLSSVLKLLRTNSEKINFNIVDHFKIKSSNYDNDVNWRKDKRMLSWFRQSLKSCKNCLDIGTGTGLVGWEIKKNKSFVIGLDISQEMLNVAKTRLDVVIKGDAINLPFLDSQFNGISMRQVLHYVDDIKCIEEAYRVLKNNGILASAHIASPSTDLFEWWSGLKSIVQPLRKRVYEQNDLLLIFKQLGFKILICENYSIERTDYWDTFIINSNIDNSYDQVIKYIDNTSQEIRNKLHLRVDSKTISYRQDWSLITCKKE